MKTNFFLKLFIPIILFLLCLGTFAQKSNKSILSIGVKQGVNLSSINFDPPVKQLLTIGYTGGLVIMYISETHAGIQAELNYSQRGWTEKLDSSNSYKRKLNYFEVPVLTHFILGQKKTRGFINIGPNLSFYSSDKESFKLLDAADMQTYYQRKLDKKFELGLVGGVGITRITPIGDFQLEFRFHYGLQNIFTSDIETNLTKSQNQLYGITLSYFFFKKDFKPDQK